MEDNLFMRIVAPYFVAGVIVEESVVIKAAPIVGWMIGKNWGYCKFWAQKKGFQVERIR